MSRVYKYLEPNCPPFFDRVTFWTRHLLSGFKGIFTLPPPLKKKSKTHRKWTHYPGQRSVRPKQPFFLQNLLTLVFQIPNVRIGVWTPVHTSWGSVFRGSFHTSSQGMTGGFWKTRVSFLDLVAPFSRFFAQSAPGRAFLLGRTARNPSMALGVRIPMRKFPRLWWGGTWGWDTWRELELEGFLALKAKFRRLIRSN